MTVAAVILAADAGAAIAPALGQARVRRIADLAWAGGALPIVVVSPDADGRVRLALAGSEAELVVAPWVDAGVAHGLSAGIDAARAEVSDLTGVLIWPAAMAWVGAETVTSLIETHSRERGTVLRPGWHDAAGWPVLVPLPLQGPGAPAVHATGTALETVVEAIALGRPTRVVDLGDPGVTHDADTPLDDLPPYEGPPDPPAGHTHEWGEDVEAEADLTSPDAI